MLRERSKIKRAKPGEIPKQSMPEQSPIDRIKNFEEVPFGYSYEIAKKEALRCLDCPKPTCIDGCPVNINIPDFITAILEGDLKKGVNIIKETNILPSICGRVCPQENQCELTCVLYNKFEPVAIGRLERFLADWERETGKVSIPEVASPTGKKVAVVGSGPAGLTAAFDLAKLGYEVVVFEALHELGGVLVYGIPEFRLPKKIVHEEIDVLKKMGVKFVTNFVIGKTATIDDLLEREGFSAVFLGTGAGAPNFMHIPGENLNGVYSANEYLTRINLMRAYQFPNYDTPIPRKKRIAVIGGGNTAMDAARTALRSGSEEVYIIYRRTEKEMPARIEEIAHAKEEGIKFLLLTAPIKYIGDDKGWVKKTVCIKMELSEPDESGRRRPVPIEKSEFEFDVDLVIVAIGNKPNSLIPRTTPEVKTNPKGVFIVDKETGKTTKKGVFAGGDAAIGASTVILAMGTGRKAAKSIDEYLQTGVW